MTDPTGELTILALPGSLRRGSLNRRLLDASIRLAPRGMSVVVHPLHGVPLYDADLEAAGLPAPVRRLKEAIGAADGLLIATPEYNAGIPGVLKNAIDWASRPAYRSPLAGKPVALMAGTPGLRGTSRALDTLVRVLESTLAQPVSAGLSVARLHEKLGDGELVDERLARDVEVLLRGLRAAVQQSSAAATALAG